MNAWLVVDYMMLFTFRLLHYAAQRLHARASRGALLAERGVVCFTVLRDGHVENWADVDAVVPDVQFAEEVVAAGVSRDPVIASKSHRRFVWTVGFDTVDTGEADDTPLDVDQRGDPTARAG